MSFKQKNTEELLFLFSMNLFLTYYRFWIAWTIATFPMGFIGYFMKKDKWWGLVILTPILIFLGLHYSGFLNQTIYSFPYHLLSTVFCFITLPSLTSMM